MSKKRLLVIEDDQDLGEMLVTFFVAKGYDVIHAESGLEGITFARSRFPNLILLDVMLPDMEGFDVCRVLRTGNLTKYIPITFLTQRDARADKVAGLQIGADDYVTKPFDIEELRLRVERSIQRATRDHLHEPRTGLPTSQLIDSEYGRLLSEDDTWQMFHIKIKGYEAFRDVYGFLAADEAIMLAGNVLTGGVAKFGTSNDFIGITERNTFALFTQSKDHQALQAHIQKDFSARAQTLYNFVDVEQGYVVVKPGTEDEKQEPLMQFVVEDYETVAG